MSSYVQTLNETQLKNLKYIVRSSGIKGITNKYAIAGLLAVVSKESNFLPKNEISYANTPNDRIRAIFGNRVSNLSEAELNALKATKDAFFDVVYGGRYGNTEPHDGSKYIGRGFNQLTFKSNYKKIATDIGVDIVNNPDLMNNIDVASLALVQYFVNAFKTIPANYLKVYKTTGINGFEFLHDAVNCFYHANAGWGKSPDLIQADKTGGLKKAKDRSEGLLKLIETL